MALFNQGEFFAAHEDFEEAWRAETDPLRRSLWQGLTQLAVGLAHWRRANPVGACNLMASGLAKLAPLTPAAAGVELDSLLRECRHCLAALERWRLEGTPLDPSLLPRLRRAEPA